VWFVNSIIEYLNDAAQAFLDAMDTVHNWIWPLWYLQYPLYALYAAFYYLAWYFGHFSTWTSSIQHAIGNILSYFHIYQYFSWWFTAAANAWSWVVRSFWNVWEIADSWWSSTRWVVQAWIDEVMDWALGWINYLQSQISNLSLRIDQVARQMPNVTALLAWFSNWWGNIQSNLDYWWTERLRDIEGLIDSAFLIRQDFWEGWQDMKGKVTEFFADPEEWLYKSVDRIIERYW